MKSRWVLAALGAFIAPALHAQSSVTIFGVVDQYVEVANGGNGSVKRLSSGGVGGSRLGFRGTEDLGSGWRALFQLENDFLADTGAQANAAKFFNRQAWVALTNAGLGTVTLGRQYTPHFATIAFTDPVGFTISSALNYFAFPNFPVSAGRPAGGINGTQGDSTTRRDNAVQYTSPALAGVQLKAFVSAGEGVDARVRSLSVGYASPKWFGTVSYLVERTTYIANNTDKFGALAVGYDFGVVKPVITWARRRGEAAIAPDIDAYQIGASAPMGQGVLSGTYAKLDNDSNDTFGASGWGLRYEYLLSKRTRLYGGVTGISNRANAAFTIGGGGSSSPGLALRAAGEDPKSTYFGVSHAF